jgi:hypothetical protein
MPILPNYNEFVGRHPETGPIRNALAYQKVVTPHTGKPISEALLLGVSGGIAFGYFTFEYKGYDPQVNLLTRNTFDPVDTILERLGIPRDLAQTSNAAKGLENLTGALESGKPPLVWADQMSMPYNATKPNKGWWAMLPIVVFGHAEDKAYIADRSKKPLVVGAQELQAARARVKHDKFRVMTLGEPDLDKINVAVKKGLEQCIRLFTQAPPKGTRENFGFTGMEHWAAMLRNTRNKSSWARSLPPGRRLYSALAGTGAVPGAYEWIAHYGCGNGMERPAYADFLEEAAALLFKSKLETAARFFRQSAEMWMALGRDFLPEDTPLLSESRQLIDRKHCLFLDEGAAKLDEIMEINARLEKLRSDSEREFPWDEAEYAARRAEWSRALDEIRQVEERAVAAMRAALA